MACFLAAGVLSPWCTPSYLRSRRSGENRHVGFFPIWFQWPFGSLLDQDSIVGLEQGKTDGGLRPQQNRSDNWGKSLCGGLNPSEKIPEFWLL